jgi:hypothetical protein
MLDADGVGATVGMDEARDTDVVVWGCIDRRGARVIWSASCDRNRDCARCRCDRRREAGSVESWMGTGDGIPELLELKRRFRCGLPTRGAARATVLGESGVRTGKSASQTSLDECSTKGASWGETGAV